MVAHGAALGSLLADVDVSTVAALPDALLVAREYHLVLDVLEQLAVALFVRLLDQCHAFHLLGDVVEAFLACHASHLLVHVGPLVVLALGSSLQVLGSAADGTALEQFEPHLGVLLLLCGSLLKDGCNLLIAVLLGLAGKVGVLVACLRLAGKGYLQVLLGLGSFEFFHLVVSY